MKELSLFIAKNINQKWIYFSGQEDCDLDFSSEGFIMVFIFSFNYSKSKNKINCSLMYSISIFFHTILILR